MKLRAHLYRLVLVAITPILLLSILAGVYAVRNERESAERYATKIARAAMSAVDAELRGSMTTIRALASSEALEKGDIRTFHAETQRVLVTQPFWLNIGLATPNKVQLMDARLPYGAHRPYAVDEPAFDSAVATGEPTIGNVGIGRVTNEPAVRIRLPIFQGGEVRYVLSVSHSTSLFDKVLREQNLPDGWVIVIADQNKRFIARVPYQPAGAPVSVDFRRALEEAPEGFLRGRTVEGFETYTPYLTSPYSGWALGVAIPKSVIEAGIWRVIGLLAAGMIVALLLAFLLAWFMAHTVTRPVGALAASTEAVARGEPVMAEAPAPIDEIIVLHRSLQSASAAVRQREEAAQREREALAREKEALSKVDRAKDEFLAMLSHELRNPLAGLTAAAQILKVTTDESKTELARGAVERQTKQMSRLVEGLLDLSSVAMGKTILHKENIDLAQLVDQCIGSWRTSRRLDDRRLTVNTRSVWVHADRARIEQVVSNLMDNAVKFTSAGDTIGVEVGEHEGEAVLTVQDNGRGFTPEVNELLFQMFFQVEGGGARSKGGMGIGLALVKRLMDMHGGSVTAASFGLNQGARFTVRLPAVRAAASVPEIQEPFRAAKPRILIVDDNVDARAMLAALLDMMGYAVMDAENGIEALEIARTSPQDVVLLDIGMPGMDGYETARRLREVHSERLVIIALTGYGQATDKERARQAGFDLHLTKPVDAATLERTLATLTPRSVKTSEAAKTRLVGSG